MLTILWSEQIRLFGLSHPHLPSGVTLCTGPYRLVTELCSVKEGKGGGTETEVQLGVTSSHVKRPTISNFEIRLENFAVMCIQ